MIPCPEPDCKAPIIHWHAGDGEPVACLPALKGRPCLNDADFPCRTPRETSPMHLPDVDDVARVIYESDGFTRWGDEREGFKDEYRGNAQAVLDLIAAHQPVWVRVEPGTLIKECTRYRHECENGEAVECIAAGDFFIGNSASFYVLHTVPAPETRDSIIREFAAELDSIYTERTAGDSTWMGVLGTFVNRIDALGGEDK